MKQNVNHTSLADTNADQADINIPDLTNIDDIRNAFIVSEIINRKY